jgi:hypothetical protein
VNSPPPLTRRGWRVCGGVNLDTATIGIGDPQEFLRALQAVRGRQYPQFYPQLVHEFGTGEDGEYSVEKRTLRGRVVGVRVECYNDVATTHGAWKPVGTLVVRYPFLVVADPGHPHGPELTRLLRDPPEQDDFLEPKGWPTGTVIVAEPGTWTVEEFDGLDRQIGVRLTRQ